MFHNQKEINSFETALNLELQRPGKYSHSLTAHKLKNIRTSRSATFQKDLAISN